MHIASDYTFSISVELLSLLRKISISVILNCFDFVDKESNEAEFVSMDVRFFLVKFFFRAP